MRCALIAVAVLFAGQPPAAAAPDARRAEAAERFDRANKHETIQNVGLIAIGVAVIAAGVGAVLLLTGDDPGRYDRPPRDAEGRGGLTLSGWVEPGHGGLALRGAF